MSGHNYNYRYLKLREVFSETLLRDSIIFIALYLFIIAQNWQHLFLLSFPMISYTFSLFFRIISISKDKIYTTNSQLSYNPLGLEKRHANRLNFISLFQLILLFWLGAESIYHPQLIKVYDLYFNCLFGLIYSFGFYWIFNDIWKNSKIAVNLSSENLSIEETRNNILTSLKYRKFTLLTLGNFFLFLVLNLVNIILQYLIKIDLINGIEVYLPGTGIENSQPLIFPFTIFIILIIFPLCSIFSLIIVYKDVTTFNKLELTNFLNALPEENRLHVIDNLKKINEKSRALLEIE
jgi:hypothetical protein